MQPDLFCVREQKVKPLCAADVCNWLQYSFLSTYLGSSSLTEHIGLWMNLSVVIVANKDSVYVSMHEVYLYE